MQTVSSRTSAANQLKMYITGAHVVSKYSGMAYRDFVEERIMRPLGMTSSTLYPERAFATGNLTQAWAPDSRRRIPSFMPEYKAELIAGAGGVMSPAEDMVRRALLSVLRLYVAYCKTIDSLDQDAFE